MREAVPEREWLAVAVRDPGSVRVALRAGVVERVRVGALALRVPVRDRVAVGRRVAVRELRERVAAGLPVEVGVAEGDGVRRADGDGVRVWEAEGADGVRVAGPSRDGEWEGVREWEAEGRSERERVPVREYVAVGKWVKDGVGEALSVGGGEGLRVRDGRGVRLRDREAVGEGAVAVAVRVGWGVVDRVREGGEGLAVVAVTLLEGGEPVREHVRVLTRVCVREGVGVAEGRRPSVWVPVREKVRVGGSVWEREGVGVGVAGALRLRVTWMNVGVGR